MGVQSIQSKLICGILLALLPSSPAFPDPCHRFLTAQALKQETESVAQEKSSGASTAASLKLYGRIEQLRDNKGAVLPLKMQELTPVRDASLDAGNPAFSAKASESYPNDFLGSWTGELTVASFDYGKVFFEFDPGEASKLIQLLKPGAKGTCTVTFFRGKEEQTEMLPCSVVFESKEGLESGKPTTVLYYLHLGDLGRGKGVTGNEISCELMKNTLTALAKEVMEQEVVTCDLDRNPETGKTKTGYSESVLRFARVSHDQLYLQAATVSYGEHATFHNKAILYGTLTRHLDKPEPALNQRIN